jgi:two-component system, OmpR family, alkaline phosphatase synthesis response regulator PhoP
MIRGSTTILVVDDEQPLVDLVSSYLEREGYRVLRAYDGRSAVEIAHNELPDLLVLDLMLPELDGLEVCRQIRQFSDAYVLMLTARTEEVDRVIGLSVGADDYVPKPFSPRELVARVKAMLRRPRGMAGMGEIEHPVPLRFDELHIDLAAHLVSRAGEPIQLTPLEFQLLKTLASHPGLAYSREQLLEIVWGGDFYGDDHVVDVHISNLRRKLELDPAQPRYIETVRGVGYRFRRSSRT